MRSNIIKAITVETLNYISYTKRIWCIGCGKRLYEMIDIYEKEPFTKRIEVLLDNDKRLWGHEIALGKKKLIIENPQILGKRKKSEIILLITSDHYNEIFSSVEKYIINNHINVYMYPQIYSIWTNIIFKIASLFPVKRQILFYAGKEPHDNADEIVRYLVNDYKGKKYSIIYIEDEIQTNIKRIKHLNKWTIRKKSSVINLFRYCFLYARSGYLLYENEALVKINKKQKLIYLNHGTIPLKNVSDVLQQPDSVDYATCPGKSCSDLYEKQYGIPKQKQIYMMPARVNCMLTSPGKLHEISNAGSKQVILWLPTFRQLAGSERKDSDVIDPTSFLKKNVDAITQVLQMNNQLLVIKKHPREKNNISISKENKNIKILSENVLIEKHITLQELLSDADALLTDYSGIAFEYMLLDRPIGYVVSDIDSYFRGFSVEKVDDYMPGKKIHDVDELQDFLNSVREYKDSFRLQRKLLVKRLFGEHAYENGAKDLINFIDKLGGKHGK